MDPAKAAEHYRVYRANGAPATMDDIVAALANVDVAFVGESHNDPIAHAVELDLLRRAYEKYATSADKKTQRPVALALEMFERDVQIPLDEYLAGLIPERQFLAVGRPWNNYAGDYRPLVEFAKEKKLAVIAANAPRRYVNMVSRNGRDALRQVSEEAREQWLPPLPYGQPAPNYAAKFQKLMGDTMPAMTTPAAGANHPPVPSVNKILDSQVLWDSTMAYSLARTLKRKPRPLVLHVNGGFHSESRMGIPDQLVRYRKDARFLVVTVVSDGPFPNFDAEKMTNVGDFVIVSDPSLPRTFDSNAR